MTDNTGRRAEHALTRAATLFLIAIVSPPLPADCAKDRGGEVFCGAGRCARDQGGAIWCSRFEDGDAQTTRRGEVLCGRGNCTSTIGGEIYCSSVPGGAVVKDSKGRVRCEGRCEHATAEKCENTRADSAG